jgi:hypothetical protein
MKEIKMMRERFQLMVRDHSTFTIEERLPNWTDQLSVKLSTDLWAMTIPPQTITAPVPRQRFLDWLFRVPQTITIKVTAKDIPFDQPVFPAGESVRIYQCNSKEIFQ